MSDEDWKRRIGITINYSPDSSEDDIVMVQFLVSIFISKLLYSCDIGGFVKDHHGGFVKDHHAWIRPLSSVLKFWYAGASCWGSSSPITLQFRDEYKDEVLKNQLSPLAVDNAHASSQGWNNFMDVDDIFDFYEDFGQTPPRTRLSRRQKERNQRVKESGQRNSKTVAKPKNIF
uniref:Uncharacterized protein n=1 Tax=Timema genevievae TaxID=629358 RepID=A0A7R9K600_TIMGE|nr:unnamed protein product [Timema genevievae]